MIINELLIKNFRGIKECDIDFKSNLNILVGSSNSTKSTILEAIKLLFNSSNICNLNPQDFYNNNYNQNIEISCIFSGFPDDFLLESNYAFFLLDEYKDSPHLMVKFICNSDFEYEWLIVKNSESKMFSPTQRKKCNVILIDDYVDKNFNFGKTSLINKYVNDNELFQKEIKKAVYKKQFKIEETNLECVYSKIRDLGKEYSIKLDDNLSSALDVTNLPTSTNILGLAENDIMISNRGKSDKKLLSLAMSIDLIKNFGVTLIDEPENSLEPYKVRFIARKINDLCNENKDLQIIVTTHSPYFVYQSEVEYINIVRNNDGTITTQNIPENLKRVIYQKASEALFAKKIICCEGITEIGFINKINEFRRSDHNEFELYGACIVNLEGDRVIQSAIDLCCLGYDVSLIMDSDVKAQDVDKSEFKGLLIDCTFEKDFEYDFFSSLSKEQLVEFLEKLFDGDDKSQFIGELNVAFNQKNKSIAQLCDENDFINIICTAKNIKKKFKNYYVGCKMGEFFLQQLKEIKEDSKIMDKFNILNKWVEKND